MRHDALRQLQFAKTRSIRHGTRRQQCNPFQHHAQTVMEEIEAKACIGAVVHAYSRSWQTGDAELRQRAQPARATAPVPRPQTASRALEEEAEVVVVVAAAQRCNCFAEVGYPWTVVEDNRTSTQRALLVAGR